MIDLASVNAGMAEVGTRLWPLDLRGAPPEIRRLIAQPTLDESEAERVKAHFLLPRQRLLELIEPAGRTPHVPAEENPAPTSPPTTTAIRRSGSPRRAATTRASTVST